MQLAGKGEDITGITPEQVLEDAKNPRSPLHKHFEWDNRRAAVQYRLTQARLLLRSISVVFKEGDQEFETRAFHVIQDEQDHDRSYMPVSIVFATPNLKKQVVEEAKKEMEGWIQRFQNYKALRFAIRDAKNIVRLLSR